MSTIEIRDPATGAHVGRLEGAGPGEVAATVARAHAATTGWSATPANQRAKALRAAARAVGDSAGELAALNRAETGRPLDEAREGILAGAATLEQYAELGALHRGRSLLGDTEAVDMMVPEPRGVVAVLTPWNDPVAIACGLLGAALVTGNVVVHKPSERSPHTGALLTGLIAEAHPDGVVNALTGAASTGAMLASSEGVDLVAHVGSSRTGRAIATEAARTGAAVLLENGGNDPLLVDEDVDPAWAAAQAALGAFANSGQICTSVERVYVHAAIAGEFLAALTAEAENRVLAPLVDVAHREMVHEQVAQALAAGATALTGAAIPPGAGAHYPATVLAGCDGGMRIMTEETFGPIAPVQVVAGFDEGLEAARSGDYGLAATVLTRSMSHAQRAWRELPVGTVKVNAVFGGAPGGSAHPRRMSGQGYGYGPELLDEMTRTKVVHVRPPGP
ncbi:aldehyde dehydrogenase family protein [Phytomonospora sp. NPDC050363]|uniref:aldehyde dehydrogenase family protein n=1 Tax=Phytomonospora sp. NPDC050363 TaxID=3155642 RepID=UPI0033DB92B9